MTENNFFEIPVSQKNKNPAVSGICSALAVIPLAISVSACSPFGIGNAAVISIIFSAAFCLFGAIPTYTAFALICSCVLNLGTAGAAAAAVLGSAIAAGLHFLGINSKIKLHPCAYGGVFLGSALWMTVMKTTEYFGIGAVGKNAVQMLAGYRYLGFHANWRGVLYGTIVMVVLITYPRKFKKLSRTLPAGFFAFLFTLILNLFLNPSKETTAISEIGTPGFSVPAFWSQLPSVTPGVIPGIIIGALAIAIFIIFSSKNESDNEALITAGTSAASGIFGGVPFTIREKSESDLRSRAVSALICSAVCALVFVLLKQPISRIPLPSAAVLLIVGMWQQVDWHSIKLSFTSGALGIPLFILTAASFILIDPSEGIIIALACGLAASKLSKKSFD